MDETVANHLVLALEALPAFGTRAFFDVAVVRPILRVHVFVGANRSQSVS